KRNVLAPLAPRYSVSGIRRHARVLPSHLLHAAAHLFLQRGVPRALQRRHELREILLLLLDQCGALVLELHELVEVAAHLGLIDLSGVAHGIAKREPCLSLLLLDRATLLLEAAIDGKELVHLRIGEPDTAARHLVE